MSHHNEVPPSRASNVGAAILVGGLTLALVVSQFKDNNKPATVPVAPVSAAAPATPKVTVTLSAKPADVSPLRLTMAAQLALDKRRAALFVSATSPRVTLYDTDASHPWCTINGKVMQIASVGRNDFTCYRWVGSDVALRLDGDRFLMMDGDKFRPR